MPKNKIKEIIKELRPDIEVQDSTEFINDGIFDSFDIVSIVSALDKEFNISIDGTKISPEYFNTLDDITKLVQESKK
ncbi:hypothetical protein BKH42_04905 [Helicobacter sp. 13S00482-2]|uniref:acyl carrier protein n=1 Tax=Helicobacter sp. 13S00482-2 TaxID=1476200 RepID=UPI000BA71970|nr:acyl carrier protein [Helicobacter sp. 13S00482-2]PAF53662.1 hypothetical protein BKH42_04905 [Helicobacter sp. 13S00482-2]